MIIVKEIAGIYIQNRNRLNSLIKYEMPAQLNRYPVQSSWKLSATPGAEPVATATRKKPTTSEALAQNDGPTLALVVDRTRQESAYIKKASGRLGTRSRCGRAHSHTNEPIRILWSSQE